MRSEEQILSGMDRTLFDMRCMVDFKFFCEKMLGLTDMGGIHEFQMEWINTIEKNRNTVIEAPSGSSKSEIPGVCYPLWFMYKNNEKKKEILLVSKTVAQSEKNLLVRLQGYILDNEILKNTFVPKDKRTSWTKTGIRTITGTTVLNVPFNVNIKGYRSDLTICDEGDSYEDPSIYFKHVTSRTNAGGKIIVISTPEGASNLIAQLKERSPASYAFIRTTVFKHPDGKYVSSADVNSIDDIYKLQDEGCYSIWPENSKFGFKFMIEEFDAIGKWSWIQNYLCEIIGESEDAAFPLKYIIESYDPDLEFSYNVEDGAMYFIGADFAISEGPRADYDAYVVVELLNGEFTIKHIETHRGIDFPIKKARLKYLYDTFYSSYGTKIVADKSQMAISLINEMKSMGMTVIPQGFSGVARLLLLQTLSNVIQSKRLHIPKHPDNVVHNDLVNLLQTQLGGFKRARTERGNETYLSKAPHDDIAISLSMAVNEAVKYKVVRVKPVCR